MSTDAFCGCRFCRGKGCLACQKEQKESERLYKERFPNGADDALLFEAHRDNPEEWAIAKEVLHIDTLQRVWGPGGGGRPEFERLLQDARARVDALRSEGEKP